MGQFAGKVIKTVDNSKIKTTNKRFVLCNVSNVYSLPVYTQDNPNSKKITSKPLSVDDKPYKATKSYLGHWYYFPSIQGKKGWVRDEDSTSKRLKVYTPSTKNTTDEAKRLSDNRNIGNADATAKKSGRITIGWDKLGMPKGLEDPRMLHLIRANGIAYTDSVRKVWNTNFNRFQFTDPYNTIGSTREYLFFIKPDLHIVDGKSLSSDLKNYPFFMELFEKYPMAIEQLQKSSTTSTNPFMPILTNSVVNTLDLPSITAESVDTATNIYGTSIEYRGLSTKSSEGFDFSLEFDDSSDLEVYHLFKAWDEYENLKHIGAITNPPGNQSMNPYRIFKKLHDQIGIFKIITAEDNETIIYFAYVCGCFPKSVPRESFSDLQAGHPKYSIDWHGQFIEDMNPLILRDFNIIAYKHWKKTSTTGTLKGFVPTYHEKYDEMNGGFRQCPFIVTQYNNKSKMNKFLLKWT